MAKVVVVYHSGYGHTQKQAEAVAAGANAQLIAIDAQGNIGEADWASLAAAKLYGERVAAIANQLRG